MTRTLLIAIEDSGTTDIDDLSETIKEILIEENIPVLSVKPWASQNPDFLSEQFPGIMP